MWLVSVKYHTHYTHIFKRHYLQMESYHTVSKFCLLSWWTTSACCHNEWWRLKTINLKDYWATLSKKINLWVMKSSVWNFCEVLLPFDNIWVKKSLFKERWYGSISFISLSCFIVYRSYVKLEGKGSILQFRLLRHK